MGKSGLSLKNASDSFMSISEAKEKIKKTYFDK